MYCNLRLILMSLIFVASASLAQAEERGEINLVIGGVDSNFGSITRDESAWIGDEGSWTVDVQAFADTAATREQFPLFVIKFSVLDDQVASSEIRVIQKVDQKRIRLRGTNTDSGLTVLVAAYRIADDQITVSGTFVGNIGPARGQKGLIDQSNLEPVSGAFSFFLEKKEQD